jgi:hypothetical protein
MAETLQSMFDKAGTSKSQSTSGTPNTYFPSASYSGSKVTLPKLDLSSANNKLSIPSTSKTSTNYFPGASYSTPNWTEINKTRGEILPPSKTIYDTLTPSPIINKVVKWANAPADWIAHRLSDSIMNIYTLSKKNDLNLDSKGQIIYPTGITTPEQKIQYATQKSELSQKQQGAAKHIFGTMQTAGESGMGGSLLYGASNFISRQTKTPSRLLSNEDIDVSGFAKVAMGTAGFASDMAMLGFATAPISAQISSKLPATLKVLAPWAARAIAQLPPKVAAYATRYGVMEIANQMETGEFSPSKIVKETAIGGTFGTTVGLSSAVPSTVLGQAFAHSLAYGGWVAIEKLLRGQQITKEDVPKIALNAGIGLLMGFVDAKQTTDAYKRQYLNDFSQLGAIRDIQKSLGVDDQTAIRLNDLINKANAVRISSGNDPIAKSLYNKLQVGLGRFTGQYVVTSETSNFKTGEGIKNPLPSNKVDWNTYLSPEEKVLLEQINAYAGITPQVPIITPEQPALVQELQKGVPSLSTGGQINMPQTGASVIVDAPMAIDMLKVVGQGMSLPEMKLGETLGQLLIKYQDLVRNIPVGLSIKEVDDQPEINIDANKFNNLMDYLGMVLRTPKLDFSLQPLPLKQAILDTYIKNWYITKGVTPNTEESNTVKKDILRSIYGGTGIPQPTETNNEILAKAKEALREAKGLSADDIIKKYPFINLKRDVPITDIHGNKQVIPEGEALTPYELKGNKVLLQDGETYIVSKNQYQNIQGNAIKAETKEFAPELKGTEETIKGASKWQGDELFDNGEMVANLVKNEDGTWSYQSDFSEGEDTFKTREEAMNEAEHATIGDVFNEKLSTKYSSYQLPGGKNYKEILIKAPSGKISPYLEWESKMRTKYGNNFNDKISGAERREGSKLFGTGAYEIKGYKSPHWDEPNVISHIRLNERTYKGKKVTFIEELQSDWAREARKLGFRQKTENPERLLPEGWKVNGNGDNWKVVDENEKEVPNKLGEGTAYGGNKNVAIGKAIGDETLLGDFKSGVPYNPLLKNWLEMTIKRALQEAVNNDSGYLAWTTGEQQAARYNLAKEIDNIEWLPKEGKTVISKIPYSGKTISIRPKQGSSIDLYIDNEGIIRTADKQEWIGKPLSEVVGKGVTEKILAEPRGILSGEGLNVGGEWAKNLYDKEVKNIVEDLTNGKVETIDMGLENGAKGERFLYNGTQDNVMAGDRVTSKTLKVGQDIYQPNGTGFIITKILGDGKFKAIQKSSLDEIHLGKGLSQWIKDLDRESYAKRLAIKNKVTISDPGINKLIDDRYKFIAQNEQTFDISIRKSPGQQAIKITPEVKAIVNSEIPILKQPSDKNPVAIVKSQPNKEIFSKPNKSETTILREKLKEQATKLKAGYTTEQKSMRLSIINQLKNTFENKLGAVKRGAELEKLHIAIKVRDFDRVKNDIVNYIKLSIPMSDRGVFLNMVKDAKTQLDLIRAFTRVDKKADEIILKQAITDLKKTAMKVSESSSISVDYRNKIKEIINSYEFQGHTQATIDKLKATQEYINRQSALGNDVELPQRILNKLQILGRTGKELVSLKQVLALQDELNLLFKLGKTKWASKQALYEAEKELRKKELLSSASSIQSRQVKSIGLEKNKRKYVETYLTARNYLQKTNVGLTPIEGLADITGMQPMKRVMDLNFGTYLTYNDDTMRQWYTLAKDTSEEDFKKIGAYAIAQQTGGIERLANSGVTQEEINNIVLTPRESRIYEFVRKTFDDEFPAVKKYALDNYNRDVGTVKNYVSFLSDNDAMNELEMYERFGSDVSAKTKTVEQGFTQKRQDMSKQKLELNIDKIFRRHIDNVAYMLTMGKDIKQYFEIVNSPEMKAKLGDIGSLAWLQYLDLLARKGGTEGAKRIAVLDAMRRNLAMGVLSFRISSAAIQFTSFADTVAVIGADSAMKGAINIATSRDWRNFVMNNFPEVKKALGDDIAFREFGEGMMAKLANEGSKPLAVLDALMRSVAVAGAYEKLAKEKGVEIDLTKPDIDIIQEATKLMRHSQGSSFFKDQPLSLVSNFGLTDNKSVNKLVLTFQSFMLARWDNMKRQIWRLGIEKRDYGHAVMSFLMLIIVAGALEEGIRRSVKWGISKGTELITGEPSPIYSDSFTEAIVMNGVQAIPIFGNIASSMSYGSNPVPVINAIEQATSGLSSMINGVAPQTKLKGAINFTGSVGSLLGIAGSSQLAQLLRGLVTTPKKSSSDNGFGLPSLPKLPKLPSLPKLPKI